jgi:hypothetical protein
MILESQQAKLKGAHLDSFPVTLRADAGAVQARRMMARLLSEQERAEAATLASPLRETA